MFCPKTLLAWRKQASAFYSSTTPYDPSDSGKYMSLCPKIVLPVGVVEQVCTDEQKLAAALTGGVFVVRIVCGLLSMPPAAFILPDPIHVLPHAIYTLIADV